MFVTVGEAPSKFHTSFVREYRSRFALEKFFTRAERLPVPRAGAATAGAPRSLGRFTISGQRQSRCQPLRTVPLSTDRQVAKYDSENRPETINSAFVLDFSVYNVLRLGLAMPPLRWRLGQKWETLTRWFGTGTRT